VYMCPCVQDEAIVSQRCTTSRLQHVEAEREKMERRLDSQQITLTDTERGKYK